MSWLVQLAKSDDKHLTCGRICTTQPTICSNFPKSGRFLGLRAWLSLNLLWILLFACRWGCPCIINCHNVTKISTRFNHHEKATTCLKKLHIHNSFAHVACQNYRIRTKEKYQIFITRVHQFNSGEGFNSNVTCFE